MIKIIFFEIFFLDLFYIGRKNKNTICVKKMFISFTSNSFWLILFIQTWNFIFCWNVFQWVAISVQISTKKKIWPIKQKNVYLYIDIYLHTKVECIFIWRVRNICVFNQQFGLNHERHYCGDWGHLGMENPDVEIWLENLATWFILISLFLVNNFVQNAWYVIVKIASKVAGYFA